MNVAAEARAAALPIEVKKHAYRQTQDGIVISFVVHPNDVSPKLAAAPLGTRYMCALVEVNEDGTPVAKEEQASREKPAKDRKRWNELPLSQQAAMRCNEPAFDRFLRQRFKVDPDMGAAEIVRQACGIHSRKELDEREAPAERWRQLDADYDFWLKHPEAA